MTGKLWAFTLKNGRLSTGSPRSHEPAPERPRAADFASRRLLPDRRRELRADRVHQRDRLPDRRQPTTRRIDAVHHRVVAVLVYRDEPAPTRIDVEVARHLAERLRVPGRRDLPGLLIDREDRDVVRGAARAAIRGVHELSRWVHHHLR